MSPVRPGWIGPTEWGILSADEKVAVAAMDPAAFSEWKAAREQGQAAEWRRVQDAPGSSTRPRGRFNRLAVFAFVVSLLGGVDIDWRHGYIWTLRGGKGVRFRWFNKPEQALGAAGLRE